MIYMKLLLPFLTLFWGCTSHYHYDISKTRGVQDFPDHFKQFTKIEKNLVFTEKLVAKKCDYNLYDISISHNGKELTALRWYHSKKAGNKVRPVDFIWPILAGKKMVVAQLYATDVFVPLGVDAVIIRQKEKLFSREPLRKIEDFSPFHQETVRHMMRTIRWAKRKKVFDQKKFGMTGTSYGGILTSVCMAFTPQFISHKIVMGAGGVSSILTESVERGVRRWRDATLEHFAQQIRDEFKAKLGQVYNKNTQKYEKQIAEAAKKEFIEKTKTLETWDPYFFAKYAHSEKIAMIITLCDVDVPTKNQKKLWRKLGKPEALFVKTGHYTLALAYFQVRSFLKKMTKKHYGIG